ncbi:MAG: ABC transporter ATP-binding protein [Thermofilaceae archaeon]
MSEEILRVENLKIYYRSVWGDYRVVDDVSLSVYKGEIFGVAGESGCGKSTLVEGVLRLVKPPGYIAGGKVIFEGKNIFELGEEELRRIRWRRISYVPQGAMNALNPVLRIEEQMIDAIIDHAGHLPKEKYRDFAVAALEAVGLPSDEVLRMYPHELSGGMRQRVIIATAIALSPSLVVADEPVTALDVVMTRAVLETLAMLKEKYGMTVVFVSHDMAAHSELVDRLAIMYAGKVVEIGGVEKVFYEPLHPYTQGLINAIPRLNRRVMKPIPGLAPSPLEWPSGCRFHPRCPLATEKCRSEIPELREVEPGRIVACHLLGGGEP